MTPRLLVADARAGVEVTVAADRAHYLLDVLRLRSGDAVEVFDGRGGRLRARIVAADRRGARLAIEESLPSPPPSPLRLTLVQGLAQGDRMDLVIEKACELGVLRIVPVFTERSLVRLDPARAARRHAHWQRIAEAACMQCQRDDLPVVDAPASLAAWLAKSGEAGGRVADARLLLLSPGATTSLTEAGVDASRPVEILVGPESGLSDAEEARAIAAGFEPIRLGARILRTETAGLAAIAALQAIAGDF
ncbi:MAG: 16S rRNA (uracil(1498)-N(3))-methyltransferase [Burkholderiaceae bacterium]